MNKPTPHFDRPNIDAAYEAHCALIELEASRPGLKRNAYWKALRDTAFARFKVAFEVTE